MNLPNLSLSDYSLFNLVIAVLVVLVILMLIRAIMRWYATRIAPTKPIQATILKALIRPTLITLLLMVVSAALYLFFPMLSDFVLNLLTSIVLIVWTTSIIFVSRQLIKSASTNLAKRNSSIADAIPMLTSIAVSTILFLSMYLLFLIWGINLTPLIALIGIIGTALSFAARDVVGNILSGISIFMTQPFKVGDYIIISEDFQGKIQEIGIQQTKLLSPNQTILIIPNSTIATKPIENQTSGQPTYHFTLPLTLPKDTDLKDFKTALMTAAKDNAWIVDPPQPKFLIKEVNKDEIKIIFTARITDPTKHDLITHQLLKIVSEKITTDLKP